MDQPYSPVSPHELLDCESLPTEGFFFWGGGGERMPSTNPSQIIPAALVVMGSRLVRLALDAHENQGKDLQ